MEATGVKGFKFIVGGADNNCETCLAHKNKIYTADELSAFAFFPPLHPNCGCYIELPFEDPTQDNIPWYQWILREYSDKDEDYIQKFGKKNIAGGLLNFIGALFDFPKSLVMNAGLAVIDFSNGNIPQYYGDRLSFRDFNEIVSEKYGALNLFELLDELRDTNLAGNITANVLEIALELVTDPIFLFSVHQAVVSRAASTAGTLAYNEALSSGKIIDSAELYWRKYLAGNPVDDVAQGARPLNISNLDDCIRNPKILGDVTPEQLYKYLTDNGLNPSPLSRGNTKGIPFSQGGGFKVTWGGDRILQYHPSGLNHHGGVAYYKISSGPTGTLRIDLSGNIIP